MKKFKLILPITIMLCMSLAACGTPNSTVGGEKPGSTPSSATPNQEQITYSNLADANSRDQIMELLRKNHVSNTQIETLKVWVEDYNSRVSPPLAQGFNPMENMTVNYESLTLDAKKLPDGSDCPEANCRLTAFLLFKNLVSANQQVKDESDILLMFDINAIDNVSEHAMAEKERNTYITLFNSVSLNGASTLDGHIQRIQDAWKKREIVFENNSGISLISLFLHSSLDDLRFVGHAGILMETDDGLVFFEKYSSDSPYQATKLRDRKELKKYLLARSDIYGEKTDLEPILMENDKVL